MGSMANRQGQPPGEPSLGGLDGRLTRQPPESVTELEEGRVKSSREREDGLPTDSLGVLTRRKDRECLQVSGLPASPGASSGGASKPRGLQWRNL